MQARKVIDKSGQARETARERNTQTSVGTSLARPPKPLAPPHLNPSPYYFGTAMPSEAHQGSVLPPSTNSSAPVM